MNARTGLEELKDRIDAAGTRADFASKVKIGEPYLSMILSGSKPIDRLPVSTVLKISELSGLSIERLVGVAKPQFSAPVAKKRAGRR